MATNDAHSQSPGEPTFEDALKRLEEIVGQLEAGQLGLEQSLARYEEGVKLLRRCYELLQRAERRIELLTGVDASGRPITQPFDASATLPPERLGGPSSGLDEAEGESDEQPEDQSDQQED